MSGSTKVVYVPNPNFRSEVMSSVRLAEVLTAAALAVAGSARVLAPVDEGDYRASIEGGLAPADTGAAQAARAHVVGRVASSDYKANWIEYGTGNPEPTPPFAPLRRGAESAGFIVVGGRE